ncbi:MAG: ABC transporter ATP-binding protein [Gammaproteobacteria bacterium]|nr:ABC transporter ATP-binding protein [Gammaproteobacteria bacterium]
MTSTFANSISLRNLTREFREGQRLRRVLDHISADIAAGESVAIRGRSGSGKSTLLNLVGAIDAADNGEICVAGMELSGLPERQRTLFRRRHIGFVYQAFNLLPTLNVGNNIRLVLELNGVAARSANLRVKELLAAVGLADRASSLPDQLSGGEQQRVAIARALSHRPAVLLADEPTGNLDDDSAKIVLELLQSLRQTTGTTLLIATHSERISSFCDRALELEQGRLRPVASSEPASP